MAEPAEHPVYERLKVFQAALDGIERSLGQLSDGMAALDEGIAIAARQIRQLAAARQARQLTTNDFSNRLGRIEQRLGLPDVEWKRPFPGTRVQMWRVE